ncbi:hypothetical protein F4810DRAFT_711365 [Camillea tinctor]|nr:hypothetical protein F4810DRAFT_711365 [Camillea tinctor]
MEHGNLPLRLMEPLAPTPISSDRNYGGAQAQAQAGPIVQPPEPKLLKILGDRAATPPQPKIPEDRDVIDHLFGSDLEKRLTISTHNAERGAQTGIVPPIFQYGVQYSPMIDGVVSLEQEMSSYECRSVIIYNIRKGTDIRSILSRVRGGRVDHAEVCGNTAFVKFVDWKEAHGYVKYAREYKVFGRYIQITLANMPSYPLHPQVAWDLNRNFTRCIVITEFDANNLLKVLALMQSWFRDPLLLLEEVWLGWCGRRLFLSFRAVAYATRAYHALLSSGTQIHENIASNLHFAEDLCSRPLDELRRPAYLARGSYPSLLDSWKQQVTSKGIGQYTLRTVAATVAAIATTTTTVTVTAAVTMTTPTPNPSSEAAAEPSTSSESEIHLVPKIPGGNPMGKWCTNTTCSKDENCRHFRIVSQSEYRKQYNYDLFVKDRDEWCRQFRQLPIIQDAVRADHGGDQPPTTAATLSTDFQRTTEKMEDLPRTGPSTMTTASTSTSTSTSTSISISTSVSSPSATGTAHTPWPERTNEHDQYIEKWRLPQNDPAYRHLLERDCPYALQSEVHAIARQQPFRTYKLSEMRQRYSGVIAHKAEEDSCKRGEDDYFHYLNARERRMKKGLPDMSFKEWIDEGKKDDLSDGHGNDDK